MAEETVSGLPLIADSEADLAQLEAQLDLYEKGRKLRRFVNDPDWEVVVQILRDYRDKYRDALIGLPPGAPGVLQSHAAASAANDVFTFFEQDISNAVKLANNPPEELKDFAHGVHKSLDITQIMGG